MLCMLSVSRVKSKKFSGFPLLLLFSLNLSHPSVIFPPSLSLFPHHSRLMKVRDLTENFAFFFIIFAYFLTLYDMWNKYINQSINWEILGHTTRLTKKATLLIVDFDDFTSLKTSWDLERDFQGASFEPNRSFLALFVREISKVEVKN